MTPLRTTALALAFATSLFSPALAQDQAAAPATAAQAPTITITLSADAANPPAPRMGDRIRFHSVIRNEGTAPIHGLVSWVSLVQIDKGREQPVDLEDWSAHKADVVAGLVPGATRETDWPFRLIQDGTYRVVVSATAADTGALVASNMLTFTVAPKPVVESVRVIPIGAGIPLLLMIVFFFRRRRGASV